MLVPSGWILTHLLRALLILVPLSMTSYYLFSTTIHQDELTSLDTTPSTLFHSATSSNSKKDLFISQSLAHDLNPRFDGSALTELCAKYQWNEGLMFKCDPAEGGIGNVRNIFLNCFRYAIEAGATSIILPTLIPLQKSAKAKAKPLPMSHFFETNYFTHHFTQSCPQITLLPDTNSLWDKPSTSPPVSLLPDSLDTLLPNELHKSHQTAILKNPSDWARSFHAHLQKVRPKGYSKETPILINLKQPLLLQWPLKYDTAPFVSNFGLLLKFKKEIREMAASVLYAIDQNHRLRIDPMGDPTKIQPNLFYGAHLRTAPDAVSAGWTSYRAQSENYFAAAMKAQLSVIYVSSDNKEDTKYFAREARDKGIEVTNAMQALSAASLGGEMEGERKRLLSMERPFRHCVDWVVLSRASVVGGTWESSFSWGVAMGRHRSVESARWGVREDENVMQNEAEKLKKRVEGAVSPQRIRKPATQQDAKPYPPKKHPAPKPADFPKFNMPERPLSEDSPQLKNPSSLASEKALPPTRPGAEAPKDAVRPKLAGLKAVKPLKSTLKEEEQVAGGNVVLLSKAAPKANADSIKKPTLNLDDEDEDERDDSNANPAKAAPEAKTSVIERPIPEANNRHEQFDIDVAPPSNPPLKTEVNGVKKPKPDPNDVDEDEGGDVAPAKAASKANVNALEKPVPNAGQAVQEEVDEDVEESLGGGGDLLTAGKGAPPPHPAPGSNPVPMGDHHISPKPASNAPPASVPKPANAAPNPPSKANPPTSPNKARPQKPMEKQNKPQIQGEAEAAEVPLLKEGVPRVPIGPPHSKKPTSEDDKGNHGRQAWEDTYSTIFGPESVGEMFWGGMWP